MGRFKTLIEALEDAPGEQIFVTFWTDEDDHEDVSFAEFRRRASCDAQMLRNQGVAANDRVIVLMPQGIPAMTAFAGSMLLGAVPAFLAYPNFKIEPAKYRAGLLGVTANLRAQAIVIDRDFPEEFLEQISSLGDAVVLRAGTGEKAILEEFRAPAAAPDDLAFIQHSAGTTGLQKGVALTHRAVLAQLDRLAQRLEIVPSDRIYSWLPLYHDMGLVACFMLPLVCHIPLVMQSPIDWVMHPESMLQLIGDYRCSLSWLPNFAFQFVARRCPASKWADFDLSSLRALINCSEPVRASSLEEFRAVAAPQLRSTALQSSYAMAENVFAVTQSDLDQSPKVIWADASRFRADHCIKVVSPESVGALALASSGRLLPEHELRIMTEDGAPLEDGRVGEIWIRSDCLFQGYFNRPDLTAAALVDGWYRTGDLGFRLGNDLFVVGRKKDLLIVGGENLYPQDIEEIAAEQPEIHDGRVIALGLFNPELGTEDIVVIAEVGRESALQRTGDIEAGIRARITAGLGITVQSVLIKPPKWLVKSTAGKPARSATREKLLQEHPELQRKYHEALE